MVVKKKIELPSQYTVLFFIHNDYKAGILIHPKTLARYLSIFLMNASQRQTKNLSKFPMKSWDTQN